MPPERGIILWTLRYGDEVRDAADYFEGTDEDRKDASALKLVEQLIDKRTADWTPKLVEDPVQDRLIALIEAKKKGRKRATKVRAKAPEESGKVISIMDALKRSIDAERGKAGKR